MTFLSSSQIKMRKKSHPLQFHGYLLLYNELVKWQAGIAKDVNEVLYQSEESVSLFQKFWLRATRSSTICPISFISSASHRRRLFDIFWETLHECRFPRRRKSGVVFSSSHNIMNFSKLGFSLPFSIADKWLFDISNNSANLLWVRPSSLRRNRIRLPIVINCSSCKVKPSLRN